ncbi:7-deoxyloganetin glucosyltransferase-like [Impatiens glandulifera]|uniref:7-deoxyloganetin glucosyltransferase-like n=1 Tax=Impatiens glandulifera TaxID=253017 RepID=UPI001FB0CBB5|nr:7-deoxyloganetin glucosyltransferase-like [Impatiens glandulifera]
MHAVCIPFPIQGHINPMLKLAKLLHARGFYITFVNSEFNHRRLLKSRGPHSLDGLETFRFETIPDGLPESDVNATQDITSLCKSTTHTCLAPFKHLLSKIRDAGAPPTTCIISDGTMSFTLDAAEDLGIPQVLFWTTSASGFMTFVQYTNLKDKGYTPSKDESYLGNDYLNTIIDWIPGMEGVRLKDFPSFIRTTDPNDFAVHFVINEINRAKRASAIVLNTFNELEPDVLRSLSTILSPPIYTLGPLHLLTKLELQNNESGLRAMGSNLWKEETECLQWLDSKQEQPNSVLYVNFGSITVMTANHFLEFAWGLANSEKQFLWIIRPDMVAAGETAILPAEFIEETKERGMVASWCPQEKVLAHGAIGGFLSHSGWNSTIESISAGVPMICWPGFSEQPTNCWYCCEKLGIAKEMNREVKRANVEGLVRELMDGEEGKKMREKAMGWKKKAEETVGAGGSSHGNLDKLIHQVLFPLREDY